MTQTTHYYRIVAVVCWLLLLIPGRASAQSSFEWGGYAKYLYTVSEDQTSDRQLNDNLIHIRLNTAWYPTDSLKVVGEFRFRAFEGDSVENPVFQDSVTNDYPDPKLDATFWDNERSFGYGQVDRLYLDYSQTQYQITLGRQRIAWGTNLVWNLIDLFNAKSLLDLDYAEGVGVDALRFQLYTGAISKFDLAAKPAENKYDQTYAGMYVASMGTYDLHFVIGKKNNRMMLGSAWSGYIRDAGFRGEITLIEPPNKGKPTTHPVPEIYGESYYSSDDNVVGLALSGDYTFSNSFYVHTEILYNDNGKTENTGVFILQAQDANMLSPSRLSVYQELAYDITPLWRISLFTIANADDDSSVVSPNLTWSATANLELVLTGYFASGEPLTEWGSTNDTIMCWAKYSF